MRTLRYLFSRIKPQTSQARALLDSVESGSAAAAHDCVTGAGEYIVGEVGNGGGTASEVIPMVVVTNMRGRRYHGAHDIPIRIYGSFTNNGGGATCLQWQIAAEGALETP